MTSSHPTPALCRGFSCLAAALDRRSAPRLALLYLGAVLARGGRVAVVRLHCKQTNHSHPTLLHPRWPSTFDRTRTDADLPP